MEPIIGSHNAIVAEEPQHARYRRMAMPAFHGQVLQSMLPLIIGLAREHVGVWRGGWWRVEGGGGVCVWI